MTEQPDSQDLRSVYSEICKSYHAIDDFRARLLALLPVASGAGGLLILAEKETVKDYLGPIGVFGAVVTLGLFVYELRGIQKCKALIEAGAAIETKMRVEEGPFRSKPKGYLYGLIDARTAGCIVYLTVLAAWSYMAIVGFKN
ncbi:MAG TPA: hypothetical protein VES69_06250 [Pyrinomonadaceae bacterium]|nr:hypothetical protein [Pyrinomonadaceae bacterium]